MDFEKIIREMTLEEKIAFCTGRDMWHTKEYAQYGIESIMMTDGPHGLRCQKNVGDNLGLNASLPATCFPTAVTAADSWNPELTGMEGKAIAEEAKEYGVSVVLGPGANIKRNPLGGRSFEYYSEDPYLAGKLAGSFIAGAESEGIGTSLKHFACNNQEYKRQNGNSIVDERALREIYLNPFEIAVKEGKPSTVMCSYNQINGVYSSDNKELLTDILREEWGFDGLVMTDWGAMSDRIKGFRAGCDLNMPGGSRYMEKQVLEAVRSGELSEEDIDRSVRRLLELVEKGRSVSYGKTFDRDAHHDLAKMIAVEGAVLLKNDGILPLDRKDIGIFGNMAADIRYQGAGSSHINPTRLPQIREIWSDVPYAEGVDKLGNLTGLDEAVKLAGKVKTAVLFLGLPESYESEAYDRDHMRLPAGHDRLVEEICKVNENVVVVLFGGSAMEIPWADKVGAILYMGLPGQAGAEATVDILEGKENPSGKLSETWPVSYNDVISRDTFGQKYTQYRESIFVGYRYYDKAGVEVRYPFGHGLSYTTFEYSDMKIEDGRVKVRVRNSGRVAGKETVQLYVTPRDRMLRCEKELKVFRKLELDPGEEKTVEFPIEDRFFEVYCNGFRKAAGEYLLRLGASSRDIRCEAEYTADGENIDFNRYRDTWYSDLKGMPGKEDLEALMGQKIPDYTEPRKGSFTMDSTYAEMKDDSLVIRIQYLVIKSIISRPYKKEERTMDNPAYRMILTAATDCPLRASVISSNGAMTDTTARMVLEMANGHFFRGLKELFRK